MAVRLDVQADVKQAIKKLGLAKQEVRKAAAQALNRTADQARSAAVKEIAAREGIQQKDVRKYVVLAVKANRASLVAKVHATGKAPNLIEWVPKNKNADVLKRYRRFPGVKARVFGKTITYDRTFVIKAKNGKTLVVTRSPSAKRVRGKWQPHWSKGIYGPPPKRNLAQAVIFDAMQRVSRERWPINWKQALNFAKARAAAGK